jgi:hypothetical protein
MRFFIPTSFFVFLIKRNMMRRLTPKEKIAGQTIERKTAPPQKKKN